MRKAQIKFWAFLFIFVYYQHWCDFSANADKRKEINMKLRQMRCYLMSSLSFNFHYLLSKWYMKLSEHYNNKSKKHIERMGKIIDIQKGV